MILKYFSDLTEPKLKQFASLERLYKEWNAKINVISRKDIGRLYEKHVLHSLSIAAVFHFIDGTEIIDIGTGGGFPGVPLAIFYPEVKFHLTDSIAKKLKVVDAVASEIGLKNLTTQHIRAEEIHDRKFDYAVSRAVAPLRDLWTWSRPLLKNPRLNGSPDSHHEPSRRFPPGLICLKGGDLTKEIHESNTKPQLFDIYGIFPENFFREKYVVYLPKRF